MRKYLFIILLFTSSVTAETLNNIENCDIKRDAQKIFLEVFEDPNFSSCISKEVNKSNDNIFLLKDLDNIKILKCDNYSINKIKSLGCFRNLETLDLSNNNIETLHKNTFDNLNKLTSLSLRNNKLKIIDNYLFKDNIKLKELDLGFNNIDYIDKIFFNNLVNLKSLYLGFNNLEILDKDIFFNLEFLESLSLKSNKLTNLDKNIFMNLRKLKELDLSFNKLKNLDKNLFKNINFLEELVIGSSDIDTKINCIHSSILKITSLNIVKQNNESYEIIRKPKLCYISIFTDIESSKYKYEITYTESEGYINGYEDNIFKPNNSINRYEFIKIIVESKFIQNGLYTEEKINKCKKSFKDVSPIKWYSSYVCIAKKEGIINGYKDGNFKGEKTITSMEALSILFKIYDNMALSKMESTPWYESYRNVYKNKSIDDINLEVSHNLTREEMVKLIYQFDTNKFD
jgi:hypothetical protein